MDDSNISAGAPAPAEPAAPSAAADAGERADGDAGTAAAAKRRRRGSRGGQNRKRPEDGADGIDESAQPDELPEPMREGRVSDPAAAEKALVRKPKVGDTRAPFVPAMPPPGPALVGKPASGTS